LAAAHHDVNYSDEGDAETRDQVGSSVNLLHSDGRVVLVVADALGRHENVKDPAAEVVTQEPAVLHHPLQLILSSQQH
jgi:hypothetical protein